MWVFKLGGSLAYAAELRAWLAALADHGPGRAVIVPGGGPFADQARRAQAHHRYADTTAHAMALLAMAQFGLMMAGMEGRLSIAAEVSAIGPLLATGGVPVWVPGAEGAPGVRASWEQSADSLALWLAGRIGAEAVALVKSRPPEPGVRRAADLARRGIVDAGFPEWLARGGVEAWWMGRTEHRSIGPILRGGAPPGTRIFP
jgi:aspartokinase-like uncharacterized kinase